MMMMNQSNISKAEVSKRQNGRQNDPSVSVCWSQILMVKRLS